LSLTGMKKVAALTGKRAAALVEEDPALRAVNGFCDESWFPDQ